MLLVPKGQKWTQITARTLSKCSTWLLPILLSFMLSMTRQLFWSKKIENTLRRNSTLYHQSCCILFNNTKRDRARRADQSSKNNLNQNFEAPVSMARSLLVFCVTKKLLCQNWDKSWQWILTKDSMNVHRHGLILSVMFSWPVQQSEPTRGTVEDRNLFRLKNRMLIQ